MDNKVTGANIRKARQEKGITQKELGAAISRTESSIAKYEQGLVDIPNKVLERIAIALDVPVGQLIPLAADQEPDREYERVCDALDDAGLALESTGWSDGIGPDEDRYYVWHKDTEDPEEDREEYSFRELLAAVERVNQAADARRRDYFRKMLEAELF